MENELVNTVIHNADKVRFIQQRNAEYEILLKKSRILADSQLSASHILYNDKYNESLSYDNFKEAYFEAILINLNTFKGSQGKSSHQLENEHILRSQAEMLNLLTTLNNLNQLSITTIDKMNKTKLVNLVVNIKKSIERLSYTMDSQTVVNECRIDLTKSKKSLHALIHPITFIRGTFRLFRYDFEGRERVSSCRIASQGGHSPDDIGKSITYAVPIGNHFYKSGIIPQPTKSGKVYLNGIIIQEDHSVD
jgi:hypothetical protein